jgi:8-oxo-dGTP pyrophosphatase MutT (NUDIX family)
MEKNNKRRTAHLIPYKINNGNICFFLQKRSENAERNPGYFCVFGGGIEGKENSEQGMLREIKEELSFVPNNYFYLGEYSDEFSISYYYAVKVEDNFEAVAKVQEGDYGRFFSEEEVENEAKLTENNKKILKDLIDKVTQG